MIALIFALLTMALAARILVTVILVGKNQLSAHPRWAIYRPKPAGNSPAGSQAEVQATDQLPQRPHRQALPLLVIALVLAVVNSFAIVGLSTEQVWWVQLVAGVSGFLFPVLVLLVARRLIRQVR